MRCLKNCSEMLKPRRPFATVAREMSKFGRDKNTLVSSKLENYFVLRLREKINSKYQGFVPISVLYAMYWWILTSARIDHLSWCVGGEEWAGWQKNYHHVTSHRLDVMTHELHSVPRVTSFVYHWPNTLTRA